jgi:hypothetical protein
MKTTTPPKLLAQCPRCYATKVDTKSWGIRWKPSMCWFEKLPKEPCPNCTKYEKPL